MSRKIMMRGLTQFILSGNQVYEPMYELTGYN